MASSQAASTQTTLPVTHLFTLVAEVAAPQLIEGGPQGSRMIVNVPGGRLTGARVQGTVVGPTGDWLTLRADGSARLDVRALIRTDDGALILITYNGIATPKPEGGLSVRAAPLFETADARYTWLNSVQAISIGDVPASMDRVSYEVYALT